MFAHVFTSGAQSLEVVNSASHTYEFYSARGILLSVEELVKPHFYSSNNPAGGLMTTLFASKSIFSMISFVTGIKYSFASP
jgi:hypothetical protein